MGICNGNLVPFGVPCIPDVPIFADKLNRTFAPLCSGYGNYLIGVA